MYCVARAASTSMSCAGHLRERAPATLVSARRLATDALLALALVAGTTIVIGAIESVSHVANISNLYVIGVAVLASRRGLLPAVLASVLAFAAFDWFFTTPTHQFVVDEPSEYVALLTLLVTSVIISQLLAIARRRADEALRGQRQTQLLHDVSQAALSSHDIAGVYPLALWRLNEALGLVGSCLFLKEPDGLRQVASSGSVPLDGNQRAWVEQVSTEGRAMAIWERHDEAVHVSTELGPETTTAQSTEYGQVSQLYLPLRVESRVHGVLVVGAKKDATPFSVHDRQLLVAFSNQLAVAVERQNLAEQQARARALEESDRLKTALVSSVSHELKTPLAAIKACATALLADASLSGAEAGVRRELAQSIDRETDRLTRLVTNLLDMSRLEAGALRPHLESVSIADVIADVLDRLEPVLEDREVTLDLPDSLPTTPLDFVQMTQVLTNLLDNALRYSPPGAAISISAEVVRDQLRVTIYNTGSHIPRHELGRLFDKFYRVSTESVGVGLGLSIARGIVEAHGGRIWAENVGHRGVAFTFTIPSPADPGAMTNGASLEALV
jgi:two-component system, OmpR family, sensor histidine kinase KdpD